MKKQDKTKKRWVTFREGQEVFLTAFLKKESSTYYVCRAVIEKAPEKGERQVYKAKIVAVADRPVGGQPVVKQAVLLGLTVTKSAKELHDDLPTFMCPPNWIEKDPGDTERQPKMDTNGVVDVPRKQSSGKADSSHKGKASASADQRGVRKPVRGAPNGKTQGNRPKADKKVSAGGHRNTARKEK